MSAVFDGHIHAGTAPDPERLLARMAEAGISGGAIFSRPEQAACGGGAFAECADYSERMENLAGWTAGYADRLFPVLWIHPDEPRAACRAKRAAYAGVAGFKMICDNYDVTERKSKKLLRAIAETGKPVFFHSGILWNGGESAKYNRPFLWEALLDIPGLRFSMGHCAWPWTEECIAVYGKFLNAYAANPRAAEMFLDLTPGTPAAYRAEFLEKLVSAGYDIPHNLFFGTDSAAADYNRGGWAAEWLERDRGAFRALGAGPAFERLVFSENLLRFLGKIQKNFTHRSPSPDCGGVWSIETFEKEYAQ